MPAPYVSKFPQQIVFEKSQILGQAWVGLGPSWAGLGPAQQRQKRQPCHFCHLTPGPDLTHTGMIPTDNVHSALLGTPRLCCGFSAANGCCGLLVIK